MLSLVSKSIALRTIQLSLVAAIQYLAIIFPSSANGLFENRPWQFATPSQTQTNALIEQLIMRKRAGFFDAGAVGAGGTRQFHLDCEVSATNTGNEATNDLDSSVANPQGVAGNTAEASTTGNEVLDGSRSSARRQADSTSNEQANTDSPLSATADSNEFLNSGDIGVDASNNSATNDNDQDVTESALNSSAAENELCNVSVYD